MAPIAISSELVDRTLALADASTDLVLLGIAGSPGSGKTTLAVELVGRLCAARPTDTGEPPFAVHVPMDGFHLADAELDRLGRRDRKGAPDTMDGWGYLALLDRLRGPMHPGETVYAPGFERTLEQPLAGRIPVPGRTRVVVSEGNYLLLDAEPWSSVRTRFDEVWFCRVPAPERLRRLVARHEQFGKSPEAALRWATGPDAENARIVEAGAGRADLVVTDGTIAPG